MRIIGGKNKGKNLHKKTTEGEALLNNNDTDKLD